MLTQVGPKVLEYNVRFGDPECQPILMRLKSDLLDILEATVDGKLDEIEPPVWDPRPAICVVMASQGYPGEYENGKEITGLAEAAGIEDVKVFHAGTKLVDGKVSHQWRASARCHRSRFKLGDCKVECLYGSQSDSLARSLVPKGY